MKNYKNPWILILLIITGVVLGTLIGNALGKTIPLLSYGPEPMGLKNLEVNLNIIYFHVTLLVHINVASLIGLLLAVLIFNRL
ncbi:DUF4321 domain-containing protein [Alkaliphilus peptidifermentans]|uniref:DUF4321 domain-containing protein n=1 Tax=Alkaliphilus peptidifermentans DSM 18978 TaxID=1120976 RepID=A0A1G5DNI2_9FIRM|nr:DUF4321 domain-containing protein [Alkaliphilus peptidifermentans]SCY16031.1 protein of unknown function [Alkaliphilus peptidifermentans DSM 18978]